MIKSHVITINEIDDPEIALEEFETQLSSFQLLKNTVGIVSVSTDYLDTGVYAAVAKAVPFPLIGMSAYAQNANGNTAVYLFSILVLTTDDCEFVHGISGIIPQQGDVNSITQEMYKKIRAGLDERPKLALLYAPFFAQQCSYNYLKAIAELDEVLPVFGSLASCEVTKLQTDSRALYGEQILSDRLVMLLIAGNISPCFYIGSITKEAIIIPNIGEVTAAKDNIVMEVNNSKVNEVLEKIGFKDGGMQNEGAGTLVFIADEKDSDGNIISSAARIVYVVGDGIAVFGGRVAVGSALSVGATTKEVIAETAKDVLSRIKTEHSDKTVLLYPCLARQLALLGESMAEYDIFSEELKDSSLNYVAAASGGEICPTSVTENKAYNSEHNQSLVACVF